MKALQHTTTAALQELLANQPTTPAKVVFAWQIAAGSALARAGDPRWSGDGTLRVRARNGQWAREIQHARAVIAERMNHLLGPGVVHKIIVDKETWHA